MTSTLQEAKPNVQTSLILAAIETLKVDATLDIPHSMRMPSGYSQYQPLYTPLEWIAMAMKLVWYVDGMELFITMYDQRIIWQKRYYYKEGIV